MSIQTTQLYDLNHNKIYPVTDAISVIIPDSAGTEQKQENLDVALQDIYNRLAGLEGTGDAVISINVEVSYLVTNIKDEAQVKELQNGWQATFKDPSSETPYTWKKTAFTYKGESQASKNLHTTYEIVATSLYDKIQTIYLITDTMTGVKIEYPQIQDPKFPEDPEKKVDDLHAFDNKLPPRWSETPQSIGPAAPYAFMATRHMKDGAWEKFSLPAQYGRWAFDSELEVRYQVTPGEKPQVAATEEKPGEKWLLNPPETFTGSLWMIQATSVNDIINVDSSGIRWKGPILMSIVK